MFVRMESIDTLVREAYKNYGPTLGFKEVYVTDPDQNSRFGRIQKRLTNFYFFLKDEPNKTEQNWMSYYNLIKEGKIHHAVVIADGIYDYNSNKKFSTLNDWYMAIREAVMGEKESYPPLEDVLCFGRKWKVNASYILTMSECMDELKKLLNYEFYKPEADSWDVLVPKMRFKPIQKGVLIYIKDLQSGHLAEAHIIKKRYGWKPGNPMYTVEMMNNEADKPLWKSTKTLSEIHPDLTLKDVFVRDIVVIQGHPYPCRVIRPLSEVVST